MTVTRAHFPTVRWSEFAATVTFQAACEDERPQPDAGFVIAFATVGSAFLLGNVRGRGWCTPSGHVESNEEPEAAARREAMEETGADLGDLQLAGHFCFTYDDGRTARLPAFAGTITERGPIPAGSETTEARAAALDELPYLYYRWDPLLEAVFLYAAQLTFLPGPSQPSEDTRPR